MKPQATIGADCGTTNGGLGLWRPDGRGFALDAWTWAGEEEMLAALDRLRREIRQLRAAGYDVTVYAERAFVPEKPGKYRGAGLVQSEALGRIVQVCKEEKVPLVRVASQSWRARWGMNPHAGKTALARASRGWARLLLGRVPGKGDHGSDGLLIGGHAVPEAVLWASRERSRLASTRAGRQLAEALLRVTSGAVSAGPAPLRPPGRTLGAKTSRRGSVVWTPDELAAYRERLGR